MAKRRSINRMNNRGQITMFILVGLLIVFLGAILLVVIGFVSTNINDALDLDIDVGQVNLQQANADTFGKFNEMVVVNADFWGMGIIFGMIFGLWGGAYFTRNTMPKLGVILDILIILIAFTVSLYLSVAYSEMVIALSSAGQDFAIDHLQKTNFFILNLPIFVAIIGVVMMVVFHAGIPPKTDEVDIVPRVAMG